MRRIFQFAQRNVDNVSYGVTTGLEPPRKGIGIEFTLQRNGQRWGFRFRKESKSGRNLFFVVEQRPGLFHYGLRGNFGHNGSSGQMYVPHPLKLTEISKQWPEGYWPEGKELLDRFARISK